MSSQVQLQSVTTMSKAGLWLGIAACCVESATLFSVSSTSLLAENMRTQTSIRISEHEQVTKFLDDALSLTASMLNLRESNWARRVASPCTCHLISSLVFLFVVYAIYGTCYHIHAHKVTQPYVCLDHSSIYSFYIIPLSRVVIIIILYSSYVASATY